MINWFNALVSSTNTKNTLDAATSDVVLVFDGDSWTRSHHGSGIEQYYPLQVQAHFQNTFKSLDFHTFGVGGQTTTMMIDDADTQIYPLAQEGKVNILVAGEELNAIFLEATGQGNFDDIMNYFQGAKDAGFNYCICFNSAWPKKINGEYPAALATPTWEQEMEIYYELLKNADLSQLPIDYHIDLRDAPLIGGAKGQELSLTTYWDDWLHPNELGYQDLIDEVVDRINRIFGL